MADADCTKMEALLQWAAHIGVSDAPCSAPSTSIPSSSCLGHSLVVSHFSDAGGRGFAACRNLKMGELILKVPRVALLTKQSVLQDEKLDSCMKKHPNLSSTQVEDAIWASKKAVAKVRSDRKECLVVMQEMKLRNQLLSFRSWLWASATISSRALHIPWDDAGCLCPIGDLFNYAAPGEGTFTEDSRFDENEEKVLAEPTNSDAQRLTDGGYEESSGSYCFYAKRNYKKGEQVLLSYGTYSNLDLLEHYGFLLSSNPNDKAFLELDIDANISTTWPKDFLYIQPDGKPSFALLCALRLSATPANLRRALGHLAHAGFLLSNENEMLVMTKLARHSDMVLEKLPTTIEHDVSLLCFIDKIRDLGTCFDTLESAFFQNEFDGFLQAHGLQQDSLSNSLLTARAWRSLQRWRLAVSWRLCYKKILSNCVSYCNMVMNEIL